MSRFYRKTRNVYLFNFFLTKHLKLIIFWQFSGTIKSIDKEFLYSKELN